MRELGLPDGDYEVSVDDKGKSDPAGGPQLRSSDTPDVAALSAVTHLAHDTERDPLAVLRARPLPPDAPAATRFAALTPVHSGDSATPAATASRKVWWNGPKPAPPPRQPPITLTAVDPTSCVVTGAHYIELPVADGRAKGGLISGTCKYCGLVKRYPAHIRWSRNGHGGSAATGTLLQVTASQLPNVLTTDHSTWDVALDCLVHVGGGNYHALEYVASAGRGIDAVHRHIHPKPRGPGGPGAGARQRFRPLEVGDEPGLSGWTGRRRFPHDRLLEAAGPRNPPGPGRARRAGRLPRNVTGPGWRDTSSPMWQPPSWPSICERIGTAGVVPDAGSRLVRALPTLSEMRQRCPASRCRAPGGSSGSTCRHRRGMPAASADEPGAYRFDRGFTKTDVFRAQADIEAGTAALGTVQLIKHLAARHAGRAMLAYHPERHFLAVPLGADLPGLYGRAAVLCSGRHPVADDEAASACLPRACRSTSPTR